MKKTLLFVVLAIFSFYGFSQISVGQTSDFENGTQGWRHQLSSANDPVQVTTGGPDGVDDAFLRTTSSGTGDEGSRHIFFNNGAEWRGDYTSTGIIALTFDVQNLGTDRVHLRLAFRSATSPSDWAASAVALVIDPGTTWTSVSMSTKVSDLVMTQGSGTVASVMANVGIVRILSNDGSNTTEDPLHKGQKLALQSDYDNITAVDVLNVEKFNQVDKEFSIRPNPARTTLNITLPNANEDMNLEVFDVLGKRVYKGIVSNLESSVDVSKWKSGVYLVRISNDELTQTKRFIKQ